MRKFEIYGAQLSDVYIVITLFRLKSVTLDEIVSPDSGVHIVTRTRTRKWLLVLTVFVIRKNDDSSVAYRVADIVVAPYIRNFTKLLEIF